jgi:adenylate cyclase class 2
VIEAEIKARVRDVDRVRGLLGQRAAGQASRYRDTYYDRPGRPLTQAGRELRVRVVETDGRRRCLLTHKGAAVDAQTGSKPETETEVSDAGAADAILLALGFTHLVAFDKHCVNYGFMTSGRQIQATLVTVPELEGTFIEVETMSASPDDLRSALDVIRTLLAELDVPADDTTSELYTDAVMRHRQQCS